LSIRPRLSLLLAGLSLALPGCTEELNQMRAERFANQPQQAIGVKASALSLNLRATPSGQSLTPDSLARLNDMLNRQGRLNNQTLTLLPYTPAGERIAQRLAEALEERGLPPAQLRLKSDLREVQGAGEDDLMVISEALVAQVPDCSIADPQSWAVTPYQAVGTLGCANRANLARMVSDPRDLVRPRTLAPGDGIQASAAVQRYHTDELRELGDIDFSDD
jgi:pilus (Caulobacter type) biogenesis lipoprotein CpaD